MMLIFHPSSLALLSWVYWKKLCIKLGALACGAKYQLEMGGKTLSSWHPMRILTLLYKGPSAEDFVQQGKNVRPQASGLVRVNAESAGVKLQAPFGGMKQSSSHSREQGQAAIEFFTSIKTVFVKP